MSTALSMPPRTTSVVDAAISARLRFLRIAGSVAVIGGLQISVGTGAASAPSRVCTPSVTPPVIVASPVQRREAGAEAQPPLTDTNNGFAWPDTPIGVLKTGSAYTFFASDGGFHAKQAWQGRTVGTNKAGSVVRSLGTLDTPLGPGAPQDVSITPNPDPAVNPNYPSYTYIGGGPVFQVPGGMTGGGKLLVVYHAEIATDTLYAVLGLASSKDGARWTDLGEIIRLNQSFAPGLDGFEIGDGPLVLSPDGKYFYLYFPDWIANGTAHSTTTTHVSVARALVAGVLDAAFGRTPGRAAPFEKFYEADWHLQPAIGGASTDLIPSSPYQGYIDVHFDSDLGRYVMITSNDTVFAYAESLDGLTWTAPVSLGTFGPIAAYPTAVGQGDNPQVLGTSFYIYFTHLPTNGTGWNHGELRRMTLTCG